MNNKKYQFPSELEFVIRGCLNEQGNTFSINGRQFINAYAEVAKFSHLPKVSLLKKMEYMVLGSRIFNKLSISGQKKTHMVMTARDLFRLERIPKSFTYDLKAYSDVLEAVRSKSSKTLNSLELRINKVMKTVKPKIFIANSTLDPINRMWLKVANANKITTVCLQHGLYSKKHNALGMEDDIVDYYIALDSSQGAIIESAIDKNKISLLGENSFFYWAPKVNRFKVCFVGEDWERYGQEDLKYMIIEEYKKIIMNLPNSYCYDFYYKRHPSEKNSFNIEQLTIKLEDKYKGNADIYIGFTSTFLKDMSAKGKLAIQIFNPKTIADNFYECGYCLTIPQSENCAADIYQIISNKQTVPYINERKLEDMLEKFSIFYN